LRVPENALKAVKASLSAFQSGLHAITENESADDFSQLVKFRSAMQGKNCHEDVAKQAQDESKSGLPEDVFLVTNLPQVDKGAAVVLLREIVAVPYDRVYFRTCDAISNDAFLRIGRLQSTFKYAISQAFGSLYSRIGLPEEYEQRCNEVLNQINKLIIEVPLHA
jgi:hypothetical protein